MNEQASVSHSQQYLNVDSGMIELVDEDVLLTDVVEEVGGTEDDGLIYEYDSVVHTQHDQNVLFELYQPLETESGTLMCKICMQMGKSVEFENKSAYTYHRYKVHGSYNNNLICPVIDCREIYASMIVLRKHLSIDHKLPLEMHHRIFANIGEFERWRHLVESASNCRFMMHTKQPHNRRQMMHCSRSEHKLVLQSKRHKLPRLRMAKEGACCPAQISFRIDPKTGQVETFYQLVHYGHAKELDSEMGGVEDRNMASEGRDCAPSRPIGIVFPEKPIFIGDRPMQYVQIDLIEAESGIYLNTVYSYILVVTDLKTRYTFGKPIIETSCKQFLIRILTDIFIQFGVPEGFSCGHSVTMVRDVISALNGIFRVTMKEIFNETPDYDSFRQRLYEQSVFEMHSRHRWAEMLQFTIMSLNQSGSKSAFERMFNRKPYNIGDGKTAPWLNVEDTEEFDSYLDEEPAIITARYQVGDKVFLRNLDSTPGRGNSLPYVYGLIGTVDWENSPHFPYKVHFSKNDEPWPTEGCVSAWVSSYDIVPTTHDLMVIRDEDRRRFISALMCSCGGSEYGNPCLFFRSHLCPHGMARVCCIATAKVCKYHDEYVEGEDTYQRMEALSQCFSSDHSSPRRKLKNNNRVPQLSVEQYSSSTENTMVSTEPMPNLVLEGPKRKTRSTSLQCHSQKSLEGIINLEGKVDEMDDLPTQSNALVEATEQVSEAICKQEDSRSVEVCSGDTTLVVLKTGAAKTQITKRPRILTPSKSRSVFDTALSRSLMPESSNSAIGPIRRSSRNAKAKVFNDYVPTK